MQNYDAASALCLICPAAASAYITGTLHSSASCATFGRTSGAKPGLPELRVLPELTCMMLPSHILVTDGNNL